MTLSAKRKIQVCPFWENVRVKILVTIFVRGLKQLIIIQSKRKVPNIQLWTHTCAHASIRTHTSKHAIKHVRTHTQASTHARKHVRTHTHAFSRCLVSNLNKKNVLCILIKMLNTRILGTVKESESTKPVNSKFPYISRLALFCTSFLLRCAICPAT